MKNTIMVIDDDDDIRSIIKTFLEQENYYVLDFEEADIALLNLDQEISLIVLDISMPKMDGIQFCKILRKSSDVPVLFLTARIQESDIVEGLNAGGDDYLTKPFTRSELLARVKSHIRRYRTYKNDREIEKDVISIDHLTIDKARMTVEIKEERLNLSEREFQILYLLASNAGVVFSISELYEAVWQEKYYSDSSNTVMVHIRKLRMKIEENPDSPKIITNVWGKGYKINERVS